METGLNNKFFVMEEISADDHLHKAEANEMLDEPSESDFAIALHSINNAMLTMGESL